MFPVFYASLFDDPTLAPRGKLFDKVGYHEIFLVMASIVVVTLIFGYFTLSKKRHPQSSLQELAAGQ